MERSKVIATYGNKKCYAEIKGAEHNGFFYAAIDITTPLQGGGSPVTVDSLDFKDKSEAINYYKKAIIRRLEGYNQKHAKIIIDSILTGNNKQPELF